MFTNKNGSSLLEAMIGIFVLLLLVMTTNAYMMAFIKTNISTKEISQATNVGNTIMEKLRAKPYNALADGADTINNKFNCSWKVSDSTTLKVIKLTVSWPLSVMNGKNAHNIYLSTIVAQ